MAVLTEEWINSTCNRLRSDNREDIRIVLVELSKILNEKQEPRKRATSKEKKEQVDVS